MARATHPDKARRQAGAAERAKTLTPAERLAALDARLGKGVGATKERRRLARLLDNGDFHVVSA